MISAVNVSLSYGSKTLFDELSFMISPHDRIGLVGSNGAGKTTLLKILVGHEEPHKGQIEKAKYVNVGYLPQEGMHAEGRTLYKEVESVFGDIMTLQARIDDIQRQMEEATNHESDEFHELIEIYGELHHQLEDSDAFRMEAKIEKVLKGLGFSQEDFPRETSEFSGGWQMRIALAKLLLLQPSLLLLDEPTNHLDLDSLEWLEGYLKTYDGAVMIVSHDRRFLNEMTTKTYELSLGKLTEYSGNYSFYVVAKEERKALVVAAMKNQQQQIKQTEQFIDRFRYKATKARQVQSRIKMLEKVERIEIEDEEDSIHFDFPPAPQSGVLPLQLKGLLKSYGDKRIFQGIDYEIERGDKIAFVGVNGAGKSTLSRIIAGVEPFDSGERKIGYNTHIAYFAQHQADELDPAKEVLQTLDEAAEGEVRKKLRTILGCFLFRGDDVFKRVGVLSGGEKSRLALAKMLLRPINLLILDEPTNHLDMRSKAILQEALREYSGSFVIVSHDRDFIDPIVNKVVEFKKGAVRTFPGNISDYLYKRQQEESAGSTVKQPGAKTIPPHLSPKSAPKPAEAAATSKTSNPAESEKDRKRREADERQKRSKSLKPLKEKIAKLETAIAAFEKEKEEIEIHMADPDFYHDGERVKSTAHRYKELESLLQDSYFSWNNLQKQHDDLAASL